ncbi:MAG: hypothetical protein EOM67_13320, partial [Spirochaetia bacterium]|nr:hypothetical protein [Spirochaetia bacterium]
MEFYEVAIESPNKRGMFVTSEELFDLIIKHGKEKAVYKSVFLYHAEDKSELIGKKSLYNVKRSATWIPVDIDKGKNSDEQTIKNAMGAYMQLLQYGASEENIVIWFSGTGYHLDIHSDCFGIEPNDEYAIMIKQTMMKILPNIDPAVYT